MADVPTLAPPTQTSRFPILGDLLESNPYFSAGFGLVGLGAILAIGRRGVLQSISFAQRHFLVTLEIPSHDHSHAWFLHWMARHQSQNTGILSRSHHLAVETSYKQHENGSAVATFELVPGLGRHIIRWNGVWMQVSRNVIFFLNYVIGATTEKYPYGGR
jgi:mitochondrial chaperone BCS1